MSDGKVILTIDDEEYIRKSFRSFLEDFGYTVLEAKNGIDGLDVFRELHPDLVLLDLRMPGKSGIEVLQEMKKINSSIPVIVVSGVGVLDMAVEAIRKGAWDFIVKPIEDLDILNHAIGNALEKAELINQNIQYQNNLEEMVERRTNEVDKINQKLYEEIENRKKIEQKLVDSKQLLSSIIDVVPDIIYRVDEKGIIYFISDAVRNYGFNQSELMKRNIFDFVHPEDQEQAYWHLKERRTGARKTRNYEVRLFHTDLSEKQPVFMLESEGIYNQRTKRFYGTQGILRDITARIETENKIKQSLAEKETLLKEVHHRVKNNMQIILSMLNLQMRGTKNEKLQKILLESHNRIMSMAIVHEAIYKSHNLAEVNIEQFIRSLYLQISNSLNIRCPIEVLFDLEKLYVTMDSCIPLSIILNELFTNIFKHAFVEVRNPSIKVSIKQLDDIYALLIIEDNGKGIPENFNIDEDVRSMGLSLVKTLTTQLGGKLKIDRIKPGTKISLKFNTRMNKSSLKN